MSFPFPFKTFYSQVAKNLDPDQAERIFQTLDSVSFTITLKEAEAAQLFILFSYLITERRQKN